MFILKLDQLKHCKPNIDQTEAAIASREIQIQSLENSINAVKDKLYAKFSAKLGFLICVYIFCCIYKYLVRHQ